MDFEPHLNGDPATKTVTLTLNQDGMSALLSFVTHVESRAHSELIGSAAALTAHNESEIPLFHQNKPHNDKKNEPHREWYAARSQFMSNLDDVAYIRRQARYLRIDLEEAMLEWMEG